MQLSSRFVFFREESGNWREKALFIELEIKQRFWGYDESSDSKTAMYSWQHVCVRNHLVAIKASSILVSIDHVVVTSFVSILLGKTGVILEILMHLYILWLS
jgi:hypothetical protein